MSDCRYLQKGDRGHPKPHARRETPRDVLKVPGDPLDDVADDARYGIYTFVTTTEKPRELVIAEKVRHLVEQGDLTSASIRYEQMMAESQVQYQPARLGRYRRC
jgi:hypothetical protein